MNNKNIDYLFKQMAADINLPYDKSNWDKLSSNLENNVEGTKKISKRKFRFILNGILIALSGGVLVLFSFYKEYNVAGKEKNTITIDNNTQEKKVILPEAVTEEKIKSKLPVVLKTVKENVVFSVELDSAELYFEKVDSTIKIHENKEAKDTSEPFLYLIW